MPRYNYAFDIAFEVESDEHDWHAIQPEALKAALLKRIAELDKNPPDWLEACGSYDCYDKDGD